ncbi:MAG: pitrilysin family protein [Vicinamibacterales bacterium]
MGVDRSRMPAVGDDPTFRFPAIVRHRLANGLQLRTIEHPGLPIVTFVLQVDGGSGADPAQLEGLAALTADMADEGTGSLSAIDVSDAFARIGGDYDVDVAPDATTFTLTTMTRFAGRGATLLADIVTRPSLRQDDFDRVRQLRLDRLKQLKDLPPAVAERAFLRLLYGSHPYGHLSIGTDGSLQRMVRGDVARFHASTFRPSRATLVIAGAMGHDDLAYVAQQAFGSWPGGASGTGSVAGTGGERLAAADSIEPPTAGAPRLAIVPREGAAQSELRIGHLSARRDTPDYAALLVMNAVLGGQFVSRIMLKLREEKGLTYGARSGFDWRRGRSPLLVQTSVRTAATAEAIRDTLDEFEGVRGSRPPSAQEMALAKASLTRGYSRNFETGPQVARSVAQLALYGFSDSYFEDFIPKVHAVTADDVTRVAGEYLDPPRLTTLIVGDHAAIADSLPSLGLGEPRILSAAL